MAAGLKIFETSIPECSYEEELRGCDVTGMKRADTLIIGTGTSIIMSLGGSHTQHNPPLIDGGRPACSLIKTPSCSAWPEN